METAIGENIDVNLLAFLLIAGFIAAFIDAVVGGGGLITIPAFMLVGLEPIVVLGTNKVASVMGAFASAASFVRSKKGDLPMLRVLFPLSLIGSALGVFTVRLLSSEFLRPLVVVMLIIVAAYNLKKKDWGQISTYKGLTRRNTLMSAAAAVLLGFYDGFFGPGTGSFLIFFFLCIGFDFVGAAANARVLNFASNIAAALSFTYLGLVNYYYALPVGCVMILGALAGSHMAIKKGAAYVRPLFIFITAILIGKQVWDLLPKLL